MKLPIQQDSMTQEDLQSKLAAQFPNYKIKRRAKNFLIVQKSSAIGTNVLLRKDKIMIVGNFPTIGGTLIFVLCIFLLGFLVPLIVYFAAFHSSFKKLEKEVHGYLQTVVTPPPAKK